MEIAWVYLIVAGLLEPCWVITMKKSEGFRKIDWAAATVLIMAASLYLLSLAMSAFGAGTSYAVWTGIGAICTLGIGIALYGESVSVKRIFFILLIVAGIVGLNLAGAA